MTLSSIRNLNVAWRGRLFKSFKVFFQVSKVCWVSLGVRTLHLGAKPDFLVVVVCGDSCIGHWLIQLMHHDIKVNWVVLSAGP